MERGIFQFGMCSLMLRNLMCLMTGQGSSSLDNSVNSWYNLSANTGNVDFWGWLIFFVDPNWRISVPVFYSLLIKWSKKFRVDDCSFPCLPLSKLKKEKFACTLKNSFKFVIFCISKFLYFPTSVKFDTSYIIGPYLKNNVKLNLCSFNPKAASFLEKISYFFGWSGFIK